MKKNNSILTYIIVGLFIVVFILIIHFAKDITKEKYTIDANYKVETIDKYEVNQYIPVLINDEQMSRKYLLDYINNVNNNLDNSYNLLNQEYREEKFSSIEEYRNYVKSLNLLSGVSVSKYATYEKSNYKFYDIYDNNDNRYIFKTNGVLQYELYFDDYTVEF